MTQEEKQLLLKDLCGRLSHFENWVQYDGKDYVVIGYGHGRVSLLPSLFSSAVGPCPLVEEVRPYLRPMSSMTEEEFIELKNYSELIWEDNTLELSNYNGHKCLDFWLEECPAYVVILVFDWLNAHHFDYRGLIDKGLAIEAPEGMYNG